jgi:hypothetical protein
MTRFKGLKQTRTWCATSLVLSLGMVLGTAGCSSGSGGGGGSSSGSNLGPMSVISCSLGCIQSTTGGGQFSCALTNIFENEEIRVRFSSPIDPQSIKGITVQVQELSTGAVAPGEFRVDNEDPSILIFRPIVTFNSVGEPTLGLEPGGAYSIRIPGTIQDGPSGDEDDDAALEFITDTAGNPNQVRLSCTVQASLGVLDLNPSSDPSVSIVVDQLVGAADGPTQEVQLSPATSPIDIQRNSTIRMIFNDVLDPSGLVNPVSGESALISVQVDPDQNLNDPSDQVQIPGRWSITLLPDTLSTELEFTPTRGYPSAGKQVDGMGNPIKRVVVVALSPNIQDLAGNRLINAGSFSFVPEEIDFPSVTLIETFDGVNLQDAARGGTNAWGNSVLIAPQGGGTGRLGDMFIPTAQLAPIVFHTDLEDFSSFLDDDGNDLLDRGNFIDVADPNTLTVTGGIFEFTFFIVPPGAVIRAEGSNPLQIYASGDLLIQGRGIFSGDSGAIHDPDGEAGGLSPLPGPAGSAGGIGGARPDGTGIASGMANATFLAPVNVMDPAEYTDFNGAAGVGIPILDPDTGMVLSRAAGGGGGLAWPQPGALAMFPNVHFPEIGLPSGDDINYIPHDHFGLCSNTSPGGSGAGGGSAFPGLEGGTASFGGGPATSPLPPNSIGGDNEPLNIDDEVRSLDPALGYLRGGSGGGGGGGHLANSRVNGTLFSDCEVTVPDGAQGRITNFVASSSAAGGSGGGAVLLQSGSRALVNGLLEMAGGNGGDASTNVNTTNPTAAQPGGGGSGGAVLIQGPIVDLPLLPGVISIDGGRGGLGKAGSFGGAGSAGLMRVESIFSPALDTATEQLTYLQSRELSILPRLASLQASYGDDVAVSDYFTAGPWAPQGKPGPTGSSASQSCWYSQREFRDPVQPDEPLNNFFQLRFDDDVVGQPGWDLLLNLVGFEDPQSYRGENDMTGPGGASFQDMFGNTLDGAPLVVRFQAGHAIGSLAQACNVRLSGSDAEITPGSLTPWVVHPGELAGFSSTADQSPNMIRFRIIWNSNNANFSSILSIEDINIRFTPD